MLEVTRLRAGYGETEILRGIDLTIEPKAIVALLGSNGAGKTTFNSVLSGLLRPTAGRITFEGRDLAGESPMAIVEAGLVQVPEGRHVFPNLSVRENLELGGYRRGRAHRKANFDRVADIFPRLAERMGQKAGTLSGGEQQMLAIGRGIMAEPKLIVLDEPSLGLSPMLVEEMFTLIRGLNEEGLTVLLVEQNVRQSLEIASHAFVMENGVMSLSGPSAELLQDTQLQRSYLGI